MPYKSGTLKGQLTTAEIRKLVQAHNKLSKITIPPNSSRDEILTIISKAGFRVNHEKQLLEQLKNMDISVEKAKVVTKPVKKTEEQKQQANAKKEAKVKEQKTKEAELIKKGAVIGKLVAKKQMAKEQKKEVKTVVKKDVSKDYTEEEKNLEGWKKYFMIVEENKELLKNNKIAPPFRDSYSFYNTNADVREGQSNMNNKWTKWIEILEKRIKEIKEKKPDEKIEDKKQEPPKKKRTKEEISDDRFDNFLVPEINERVVPLLRDWLKNKDDQLYKKIKTFKMWKVPPVKDEDTGTILKKGKKNPKPEYYKEKDKLLKEVKKRFTEIYKKNNFSTRGSGFNSGYTDLVDGVLKGFGSKLFKIEPDEKLKKEMKERRKKEIERKKEG
jgi:hypothetical protein